jgi:hypothetical protein
LGFGSLRERDAPLARSEWGSGSLGESGTAPIDLHLKSDPGAAKRLTAESLTPLLRGRITGVDVLAK